MLTAVATDNAAATTTSTAVGIDIVVPPPPPNVPPSVTLIAPENESTIALGGSFTLTANASDSDGTVSKVEFYAGATKFGDATSTPYELVWSPSIVGSYDLTAIATDNAGRRRRRTRHA